MDAYFHNKKSFYFRALLIIFVLFLSIHAKNAGAAPPVTFTISPPTVAPGQTATWTWNSSGYGTQWTTAIVKITPNDPDPCGNTATPNTIVSPTIGGDANGSFSGSPSACQSQNGPETYTYTYYVNGPQGLSSQSANVTVASSCTINSFNPSSPSIAPGTGTSLNFSLSGSYPWSISLLSGSVNPTPSSGTGSSGSVNTNNLNSTQTYRLTCGADFADRTVVVTNGGSNSCGTANGGSFSSAPNSNLCGNNASLWAPVSQTGFQWNWSCWDGTAVNACSATVPGSPIVSGGISLSYASGGSTHACGTAPAAFGTWPGWCNIAVNWNTTGVTKAAVYMSYGGSEGLLSQALSGNNFVIGSAGPVGAFLQAGKLYTFNLYDCSTTTCNSGGHGGAPLLDHVDGSAVEIYPSQSSVPYGGSTNVNWQCPVWSTAGYIYNESGPVNNPPNDGTSGSKLIGPNYFNRAIYIACTGGIQNITYQTSIGVTGQAPTPPSVLTFTATPNSILPGQSSTLDWSCGGGATSATVNPGGYTGISNSQSVSPGVTTTYTLACKEAGFPDATAQAKVTVGTVGVNAAPNRPTITGPATGYPNIGYTFTLTATDPDNDQIRYGIDWDMDGVADEWLPPGVTYVNSGVSQSTTHSWTTTGTQTFEALTQDAPGANSDWQTGSISINNFSSGGITFTATPPTIVVGNSSILNGTCDPSVTGWNWDVSPGGFSGTGGSTGNLSVSPAVTTTYTLSCSLTGAPEDSANVTVTVLPGATPPTILNFIATPNAISTGGSSNLSWACGGGATAGSISPGGFTGLTGNNVNTGPLNTTTTYTLTCSEPGYPSATAQQTVTVNAITTYSLKVNKTIGGNVTSNIGGINCGTTCSQNYPSGTVVTLTPNPDSNYWKFTGWTVDCKGLGMLPSNSINVTVDGNKVCTANFAPKPFQYQEF